MAALNSKPPSPIIVGDRIQQLDMLLHVQEFSSMVVLITGDPQVGKSQLLSAAHQQLSVHHQTIFFLSHEVSSDEQLQLALAQQLSCGASWADIEIKISEIAEQGDSLIVLIDDAHLLNSEVLTMLISKAIAGRGWHLVLAGDASLRIQAEAVEEDLQQTNVFHLINLMPFTEGESEKFVVEYFKTQGEEGIPISDRSMRQLWQLSKGNTGKLIELLDSQLEKQQSKNTQFPIGHIAAVLLIGCALLLSYLYQDNTSSSQEDPIAALLADQANQQTPSSHSSDLAKEIESNLSSANSNALVTNERLGIVSKIDSQSRPINSAQSVKLPSSSKALIEVKRESTPNGVQREIRPVIVENKKTKPAQSESKGLGHPLLSAPAQSYVLQLVGVRSKKSASLMADKLSKEFDTNKVTFYETTYKNAPWFVVVYGPVQDKQNAQSKAKSLSGSLNSEPWIRPIAQIQEDIRKKVP